MRIKGSSRIKLNLGCFMVEKEYTKPLGGEPFFLRK
jgi:hypothetical protein